MEPNAKMPEHSPHILVADDERGQIPCRSEHTRGVGHERGQPGQENQQHRDSQEGHGPEPRAANRRDASSPRPPHHYPGERGEEEDQNRISLAPVLCRTTIRSALS